MVLLSRVERLNPGAVTEKDQLLENLYDLRLKRDIKCWARDHFTKSFQQIREEVQCWVDEDGTPPRRAAVREAITENEPTCSEVKGAADLPKVVNKLVAGQKLLTKNLQKQQKLLQNISRASKGLLRGNSKPFCSFPPVCCNGGSLDALAVGQGLTSRGAVLEVAMEETKRVLTRTTGDLNTSCQR